MTRKRLTHNYKKASPPPQIPAVDRTEKGDHPAYYSDPEYGDFAKGDPDAWAETPTPPPYPETAPPAMPGNLTTEEPDHPAYPDLDVMPPSTPKTAAEARLYRQAALCQYIATKLQEQAGRRVPMKQLQVIERKASAKQALTAEENATFGLVKAIEQQAAQLMDMSHVDLLKTAKTLDRAMKKDSELALSAKADWAHFNRMASEMEKEEEDDDEGKQAFFDEILAEAESEEKLEEKEKGEEAKKEASRKAKSAKFRRKAEDEEKDEEKDEGSKKEAARLKKIQAALRLLAGEDEEDEETTASEEDEEDDEKSAAEEDDEDEKKENPFADKKASKLLSKLLKLAKKAEDDEEEDDEEDEEEDEDEEENENPFASKKKASNKLSAIARLLKAAEEEEKEKEEEVKKEAARKAKSKSSKSKQAALLDRVERQIAKLEVQAGLRPSSRGKRADALEVAQTPFAGLVDDVIAADEDGDGIDQNSSTYGYSSKKAKEDRLLLAALEALERKSSKRKATQTKSAEEIELQALLTELDRLAEKEEDEEESGKTATPEAQVSVAPRNPNADSGAGGNIDPEQAPVTPVVEGPMSGGTAVTATDEIACPDDMGMDMGVEDPLEIMDLGLEESNALDSAMMDDLDPADLVDFELVAEAAAPTPAPAQPQQRQASKAPVQGQPALRPQPKKASAGAQRLGQVAAPQTSEVEDLSQLWGNVPDVRQHFGIPKTY